MSFDMTWRDAAVKSDRNLAITISHDRRKLQVVDLQGNALELSLETGRLMRVDDTPLKAEAVYDPLTDEKIALLCETDSTQSQVLGLIEMATSPAKMAQAERQGLQAKMAEAKQLLVAIRATANKLDEEDLADPHIIEWIGEIITKSNKLLNIL